MIEIQIIPWFTNVGNLALSFDCYQFSPNYYYLPLSFKWDQIMSWKYWFQFNSSRKNHYDSYFKRKSNIIIIVLATKHFFRWFYIEMQMMPTFICVNSIKPTQRRRRLLTLNTTTNTNNFFNFIFILRMHKFFSCDVIASQVVCFRYLMAFHFMTFEFCSKFVSLILAVFSFYALLLSIESSIWKLWSNCFYCIIYNFTVKSVDLIHSIYFRWELWISQFDRTMSIVHKLSPDLHGVQLSKAIQSKNKIYRDSTGVFIFTDYSSNRCTQSNQLFSHSNLFHNGIDRLPQLRSR